MPIRSLETTDDREVVAFVAGPAALLVAKLHKLGECREQPSRFLDKDAYDVYRLLVAIVTVDLARSLGRLLDESLSAPATRWALGYLAELFAIGPDGLGSRMTGRAESFVGDPDTVARAVSILAADLIAVVPAD